MSASSRNKESNTFFVVYMLEGNRYCMSNSSSFKLFAIKTGGF